MIKVLGFSLIIGRLAGLSLAAPAPTGTYTNFESAQTNPIRLSADRSHLFVANTADSRLSVFDVSNPSNPTLLTEIAVGIEPVSVNPRTNDEVWVVCQESDSVSIVSVSRGIVIDTLPSKDEPTDIVFAGAYAFVTNSRSNTVNVFDAISHALVKTIPVFGGSPRAMAVNRDGTRIYAAFALSGNKTTIVPPPWAPDQPPPTNPALPPPPHTGLIIKVDDPRFAESVPYQMPDNDVVEIDVITLTVKRYYSGVGTINLGIAVRPNTGELYVSNTEARNLIRFEPVLKGHVVDNRITKISASGTATVYDLNPGVDYSVLPNTEVLSTALAQPTALVFDSLGQRLFVAAFGTDRVGVLNANGAIERRIDIGPSTGTTVNPVTKRGPRGLAINNLAKILYVSNRISNTISVVNLSSFAVVREIQVGSYDPTPLVIRKGRGFLYDAKLSGNGTAACAACHVDGENDHLAWDLGDPGGDMATVANPDGETFNLHPMKGPMVTQLLRGLKDLEPYHWRGDRKNFQAFNPAFNGLLGGSQLSEANMNAYTDFINTIVYMPNPNRSLDDKLPTSLNAHDAVAGRIAFLTEPVSNSSNAVCNSCHSIDPGMGSNRKLIVSPQTTQQQPMKVPQLRGMYQKQLFDRTAGGQSIDGFGVGNDGSFDKFINLLNNGQFPLLTGHLDILGNLVAFVTSFEPGMAPAVGYAITMRTDNVNNAVNQLILTTLFQQAALKNVDLIAKGTIQGVVRGLAFNPTATNFKIDKAGAPALTRSQLVQFIQAGDVITFMGVPPGSGTRMGIDRDMDGILDSDE